MGLLSFLFSCKNNNAETQKQIKLVNVQLQDISSRIKHDDGFSDIFFKIVSDAKTDSTHIYIAKGLYKKQVVGLQFEVNTLFNAGIVNGNVNKEGFLSNAVRLTSTGAESDAFIRALADLYEQPVTKNIGFTKQPVSATAFSLNQTSVNLDQKGFYKFKLFFEENNDSLYSEIFFNINTYKGEIELPEKDVEYRKPLIMILTK